MCGLMTDGTRQMADFAREPSDSQIDGGLRIGAAVKIADLAEHAQARRLYPALITAAEEVGQRDFALLPLKAVVLGEERAGREALTSARYEWMFWDAALQGERWPV